MEAFFVDDGWPLRGEVFKFIVKPAGKGAPQGAEIGGLADGL
jgi:hypothetical protein